MSKLDLKSTLKYKKREPQVDLSTPQTFTVGDVPDSREESQSMDEISRDIQQKARRVRLKKLTIEIDSELHRRLKLYSVDKGVHIKDYISGLLELDLPK